MEASPLYLRSPMARERLRFPFTRNCPLAVFVIQPPACEQDNRLRTLGAYS